MIIDAQATIHNFDFEHFCRLITEVPPKSDTIGIKCLRLVTEFSNHSSDPKSPACYLPNRRCLEAAIEIHSGNLIAAGVIPEYLFKDYHEIAALLLSEIVGHEIGHHVHECKRHGLKKKEAENFSRKYARAVYFNYLKSRRDPILAAYTRASGSFFRFDKAGRKQFAESKKELIEWLEANQNGISFP